MKLTRHFKRLTACAAMCTLVAFGCLTWTSLAMAQSVIEVPPGDSDAFLAAIDTANQFPDLTIIRLDNQEEYRLDLSRNAPAPIASHVILQGEGAHLVGNGSQSYGPLFLVEEEGTLELSDLVIRDFDNSGVESSNVEFSLISVLQGSLIGRQLRFEGIHVHSQNRLLGSVISNAGYLDLDGIQVVDVSISGATPVAIAIYNGGRAFIQNLLLVDGFRNEPAPDTPVGTYILNYANARMDLRYSSLILESAPSGAPPADIRAMLSAGGLGIQPHVTITGSMFVDLACPNFNVSNGFNLFTDSDCPRLADTDLIGVSPGDLRFTRTTSGAYDVGIPARSPAIDGVTDISIGCPGRDAVRKFRPQDGDGDGVPQCDIGAFENSEGKPLAAGGANGLYYSAGSDGHYVTIQEVRPDEYVIYWNTFDLNGSQAWILAVGNRTDEAIVADAYFQPDGMLVPGGGADVNTDALQNWGRIWVELNNCIEGKFTYTSGLPQFGSGTFRINRLGFVDAVGCSYTDGLE